jgi:hypothetical protein
VSAAKPAFSRHTRKQSAAPQYLAGARRIGADWSGRWYVGFLLEDRFEDYIFAWWNIWIFIILLLPWDTCYCKWQGQSVWHTPLVMMMAEWSLYWWLKKAFGEICTLWPIVLLREGVVFWLVMEAKFCCLLLIKTTIEKDGLDSIESRHGLMMMMIIIIIIIIIIVYSIINNKNNCAGKSY